MSQSAAQQEISLAPLDRIIWFANSANSYDYKRAAEMALRRKPDEAMKCGCCLKWRAITNFDLNKDGQRNTHCFQCNGSRR